MIVIAIASTLVETAAFPDRPCRRRLSYTQHAAVSSARARNTKCRVTPEQKVLAVGQRYIRVPQFTVANGDDTETCDGIVDEVVYEWDPVTDQVRRRDSIRDEHLHFRLLPPRPAGRPSDASGA